jgi:hypothetical protein
MAQKVTLDLSVFKSSGVYTLEFDASTNIVVNPQTVRLVVGFSSTGPFNTPVYIPDVTTAMAVFGDIDRSLEKKGSFFHRSIFTCLNSGPVFAINLLNLNNSVTELGKPDVENHADVVRYRSFSLDTSEANGINSHLPYATVNSKLSKQDKLLSSYYNKQGFWFPDPNDFLATTDTTDKSKLFNIVNLGQNEVSVIVRKSLDSSKPITGYELLAKEYFGANNVPPYVDENDYISDYFIDVIVISGNWTNYSALSLDPTFGKYFTPKGFNKALLNNFLSLTQVNIVLSVTGCLIPDFVDLNGMPQYIKTLINAQVGKTGILCAINEEGLDDIETNGSKLDLVGHHLTGGDVASIDFLSYNAPFIADLTYTQNASNVMDSVSPEHTFTEAGSLYIDHTIHNNTTPGVLNTDFVAYNSSSLDSGFPFLQTNFLGSTRQDKLNALSAYLNKTLDSPAPKYILGVVSNIDDDAYAFARNAGFQTGDLVKLKIEEVVVNPIANVAQLRIKWSHPLFSPAFPLVAPLHTTNISADNYLFGKADYFNRVTNNGHAIYIGYEESMIFEDYYNGIVTNEDVIHTNYSGTNKQYISFETSVDRDGFKKLSLKSYVDSEFTTQTDSTNLGESYKTGATGSDDRVGDHELNIVSIAGNANQLVSINQIISTNQVEMLVSQVADSGLVVGDLLVSTDTDMFDPTMNRLTRITSVKKVPTPGSPGNYNLYVTTDRPILIYAGNKINKFKAIHNFIQNYDLTYLPGFKLTSAHKPNDTDDRVDEILNVLTNTNLAASLGSTDIITYRYIVDTFDGQVKTNSKSQLSSLAKRRQKCLAILNAPSIQKFKNSIEPRFTDAPTAVNPSPLLNASYIADGGNLSLNPPFLFTLPDEESGGKFCGFFSPFLTIRENGKNHNIPPAAHVSNNFINKFVIGQPYSIVAGNKRGVLSGSNLVGLEYDFSATDRDSLEPAGINPIIRKRNIGLVIFGNQTSYQKTNSAFNNLHVRDLLITLETNVEGILSNYIFDFNEDTVRLEIKTIVDNYLSGIQNVGGIYNFLTIMDSSNNTPAIIDQNIGIIDIIIEPARGIQKFINRVTVARTGGIASGGFIQFS